MEHEPEDGTTAKIEMKERNKTKTIFTEFIDYLFT